MSDALVCDECGRTYDKDQLSSYHQHIYCSHKLDTESYLKRYKRIREEIPERYHDAYEQMTGSGKSPKVFQAAVCYIESHATQDDAAEIFDTTPVSIREHVNDFIDRGVVTLTEIRENNDTNQYQNFGESRVRGKTATDVTADDIRELRNNAGLTQNELADRMGLTTTAVQCWENPDREGPSIPNVKKLRENIPAAKEVL